MSNALAIAGVTVVLQRLLDGLQGDLTSALGVDVDVVSLPPEHVPQGQNDGPRINLFLYRVAQNAALRNAPLPSVDARGRSRIAHPPLALDLHYLLTAYGSAELQTEILLGYAMQRLHENPVLDRGRIDQILSNPMATSDPYPALRATGLAQQLEMVKITPASLNLDELSKLWTALKSNYRTSAAYQATVVLIETELPAIAPLPVLQRNFGVTPGLLPPLPEVVSIAPGSGQIAATLNDTLVIDGHDLDGRAGEYELVLSNARLKYEATITPEASATPSRVTFALTGPADLPAGAYTATLRLRKHGEQKARTTNVVPLLIAPLLVAPDGGLPATVTPNASKEFTLQPNCVTQLRDDQRVSLLLGGIEAMADPITASTISPKFTFKDVPDDKYWVRLRVDGVDSLLIDRVAKPPVFLGPSVEVKS
jgi:hypothetical protein